MGAFEDNISKYLRFLENDGWSGLIDERWKEVVRKTLAERFPEMTGEEWNRIETVAFL